MLGIYHWEGERFLVTRASFPIHCTMNIMFSFIIVLPSPTDLVHGWDFLVGVLFCPGCACFAIERTWAPQCLMHKGAGVRQLWPHFLPWACWTWDHPVRGGGCSFPVHAEGAMEKSAVMLETSSHFFFREMNLDSTLKIKSPRLQLANYQSYCSWVDGDKA